MTIDPYILVDSPELSYRYKLDYQRAHVIWRNGFEHWFTLHEEGWMAKGLNVFTETLQESIINFSTFYAHKVDYRDSIIDDL